MPRLPPGLYDEPVTERLRAELDKLEGLAGQLEDLDGEDSATVVARYLYEVILETLSGFPKSDRLERQLAVCNELIACVAESPDAADDRALLGERLLAVNTLDPLGDPRVLPRPQVPLGESALLVNAPDQPSVGSEINAELASADRVDLLCAFIKWQGFRLIEDRVVELERRGVPLRILTTTYIGATDRRALDKLHELGAEIKVSYEARTTRLHAKAWLFHRDTGFSTAYVGSSNLSRSALLDGLEWNVRLSAKQHGHLLETFRATFEQYWEDVAFEAYDPSRDAERFDLAIQEQRGGRTPETVISGLQVRPWPHQVEMLEELRAVREIHGHHRSLVVAATGTGKTVLAGLDYARLRTSGTVESLLFVAHRKEILEQSLAAFRHVVRRGDFGEIFVGGSRPQEWRHVFASIQSLSRVVDRISPAQFDMVIVDEFHHAEAPTYERLLTRLEPKILLGLTATPERADGKNVSRWFGGRIDVELRLWEALDRGLLCPFQYFAIHDDEDLREIRWVRGRYDPGQLSNLYTGNDARASKIFQAVHDKVGDMRTMRALGFCVSIQHAEFMAAKFREFGLPAVAVSADTGREQRASALRDLRDGMVNVVFAVDLFNEGVDIPDVDTVLFLRPTESATIFLQQLGRGLRLAEAKACLTALDFVGHQHASFRFDHKLRALTGASRRDLEREIEARFPHLPAGCHIQLDRVAQQIILDNVRQALHLRWPGLVAELRTLGDLGLSDFLKETQIAGPELYKSRHGGWLELRRQAGFESRPLGPLDKRLGKSVGNLFHVDDGERLATYTDLIAAHEPPVMAALNGRQQRLARMLFFNLFGSNEPPDKLEARFAELWPNEARRQEIRDVLAVAAARRHLLTEPLDEEADNPLAVHATYRRDEIVAAFGGDNPGSLRQGVRWVEKEKADFFIVTLNKTEKHFSPSTRYQDYAISPTLFHWESQSTTTEQSPTGQRYVHHEKRGSTVHLFVRESKFDELGRAMPFFYAGRCRYLSHEGERPLAVRWELEHPLPMEVFQQLKVAAG